MKKNNKKFLSYFTDGLANATWIIPFSLAVGACSGLGINFGMVSALITSLLVSSRCGSVCSCSWITLLMMSYVAIYAGQSGAFLALALGGLITVILSFAGYERLRKLYSKHLFAAFTLICAFFTTVLQTTHYFGIGAVGADIFSMFRSYGSLGFHPNWRGVLYGTIVMVIMITFPRKYKKLFRRISASLIAVIFTTALNFFLNPVRESTAINEVSHYGTDFSSLFSLGSLKLSEISVSHIPFIIIGAISLSLLIVFENVKVFEKEELVPDKALLAEQGIANIFCALFGGCAASSVYIRRLKSVEPCTQLKKSSPVSNLICAAVCALTFILGEPLISRIPVHSLAVVLIVYAWQSVLSTELYSSFRSGRFTLIMFIVSLIISFVGGPVFALPAIALLGFLMKKQERILPPKRESNP